MNLYEILTSDDVVNSINENINYLINIIPEIKCMFNFDQKHPDHNGLLWEEHVLIVLNYSPNIFDVRLALLLHDIGKPFSFTEGDVRHYKHHAEVSCIMTQEILNRLNFSPDYIDKICNLVKYHDTPITMEDIENGYFLSYERLIIQECDVLAHNPNKLSKRKEYLVKTKKMFN